MLDRYLNDKINCIHFRFKTQPNSSLPKKDGGRKDGTLKVLIGSAYPAKNIFHARQHNTLFPFYFHWYVIIGF